MSALLGFIALVLMLCFSRSVRFGSSGVVGAYLGLTQIPVVAASVWAMASSIGWFCVAPILVSIVIAGLAVDAESGESWRNMQPIVGGIALLSACGAMFSIW